jgi:DNA modification methylase
VTVTILHGDCRTVLPTLADCSIQCCVTSPPYYGLRDYGVAGQIGLEPTPDEYVAEMVAVFREVRRVLRHDGTLWLNIGDSYAAPSKGTGGATEKQVTNAGAFFAPRKFNMGDAKQKDLMGIPWLLAFALRAGGWFLRSDIIWHKPNPMPESVRDRPTSAHEHVFLLTKRERYFYDAGAIAEDAIPQERTGKTGYSTPKHEAHHEATKGEANWRKSTLNAASGDTRNARNVWTIATQPYSGAHFATMPPELAERCIKAGTKPGDTVLDPFSGAGTTGLVADRLNRHATLIELNPEYRALAGERITADAPLFGAVA